MENVLRVAEIKNPEVSDSWPPESMSWEITPQNEKIMFHKILLKTFLFSLVLTISSLGRIHSMDVSSAFSIFFWFIIFFAIIFAIIFAFSYKFPFPLRSYQFGKDELAIRKGDKTGQFSWGDFDYFYEDPDEQNNLRFGFQGAAYERDLIGIRGKIFYLKLKPKNFFSWLSPVSLKVHTLPENYARVYDFLLSNIVV